MSKIYDNLDKYKNAVLSDCIKSSDIMKEITMPKSVYKYRKFDTQYLKESLDGNVFFSKPADMNVNDPYDCRLKFDEKEVFKAIFPNTNDNAFKEHPEFLHMLEEYKKSIQTVLRVGCFTTCDYTKIEMWDNQYFGDEYKGYCIEYKVEPRCFYPDTLVFLKVLYDNNEFNATDAMKNFVEWVKLKQDGRENSLRYKECAMKMVCRGYNHTLFKPEEYKGEDEWRIIIPKNRYVEYFGKEDVYTKDFSSLMQAIYLGSEFRNTDKSGEMYEYALEVCKRLHIPLYIMQRNGDKLEEIIEYSPDEE